MRYGPILVSIMATMVWSGVSGAQSAEFDRRADHAFQFGVSQLRATAATVVCNPVSCPE